MSNVTDPNASNSTRRRMTIRRTEVRLHLKDATALLLVLLTWAMLIAAVVR